MVYGKLKSFSIILVVYDNGKAWYKTKKGRNISSVVAYFSKKSEFRYLKIFEYDRKTKTVGRKLFYYTKSGSYGFK